MTLGMLDLSIVTDRLIDHLKKATADSLLWTEEKVPTVKKPVITYTGLAPDAAFKVPGCQVSVFLFHVSADKFHRNTFPTGGPAQTIPRQPLALSLQYLLTAHSEQSYVEEQQAMSIALKCLHEHPVVSAKVPIDNREEEFTLTLEAQSLDEIGRLWQSLSTPLRLSAVYRASVIFLEPPAPAVPKPVRFEPEPKVVAPKPGKTLADVPEVAAVSPPSLVFTADATTGVARIEIDGAGFVAGKTQVRIRALALTSSNASPPEAGAFHRIDASTLDLRVPDKTPPGRYLVHLHPADDKPELEVWLDVP
jgi:hypothetical protein